MAISRPSKPPSLVFANSQGEILDYNGLRMAGSAAGQFYLPASEDLIELPAGSELFTLPGRLPVGIEPESSEAAMLDADPYDASGSVQAVAAFMAPAHTAIYSAAYYTPDDTSSILPLFAYTAVGWCDGKFWVAGFPGLAIFTMAVGANFIGDGLRDLLDPKLRTQF